MVYLVSCKVDGVYVFVVAFKVGYCGVHTERLSDLSCWCVFKKKA